MKFEHIKDINSMNFSDNPYNKHFMQSVGWARVKENDGWESSQVIIKEDNDHLITSFLLLKRKIPLINKYYYYIPKGFEIDYKRTQLLKNIIEYLEIIAKNENVIYFTIDPEVKIDNQEIHYLFEEFGFIYFGKNLNFETIQPRFTFQLNKTDDIYANMHPKTKKAIKIAKKNHIEVTKENIESFDSFYSLMVETAERDGFTSHTKNYYKSFYENLHNEGMSDLYIATFYPEKLYDETKQLLANQENEVKTLQEKVDQGASKKMSNKLEQSKQRLVKLTKDIVEIEEMAKTYPNGIVLSSIITAKYKNTVWTVHGGNSGLFKNSNANYFVYSEIIEDAFRNGYEKVDFFGTTGDESESNPVYGIHLFKKRFGGDMIEFIGQYDYPLSNLYFTYKRVVPMIRKIRKLLKRGR
jgi:peptidoglycan pentaglycine glycine transferase (the first glycine)